MEFEIARFTIQIMGLLFQALLWIKYQIFVLLSVMKLVLFLFSRAQKDAIYEHASMAINVAMWFTKHAAKLAAREE